MMMVSSETFCAINLLRGALSIMVLLCHALHLTLFYQVSVQSADPVELAPYMWFVERSVYWVYGFFILSGFCIHSSVLKRMRYGGFTLRSYMLARVTRIAPLYYIGFALALAVELLAMSLGQRLPVWNTGVDFDHVVLQLFGVQGITGTFGCYAASWSLTHEEFYYLCWPLFVGTGKDPKRKPVLAATLVFLAFFAAAAWFGETNLLSIFGLGLFWLFGAMLVSRWSWLEKRSWLRKASQLWPLLFVGYYLLDWHLALPWSSLGFVLLNYLLIPVFFLMLVAFATWSSRSPRFVAFSQLLGDLSFPLYLFHGPVLILASSLVLYAGVDMPPFVFWGILVASGLLIGFVPGMVLERRILRWRRTIVGS